MQVSFVFSYSGYGLVALFTRVDKHVHYAWSAIILVLCTIGLARKVTF